MSLVFHTSPTDCSLLRNAFVEHPKAAHDALVKEIRCATQTGEARKTFYENLDSLKTEIMIIQTEQLFLDAVAAPGEWIDHRSSIIINKCVDGTFDGDSPHMYFFDIGGLRALICFVISSKHKNGGTGKQGGKKGTIEAYERIPVEHRERFILRLAQAKFPPIIEEFLRSLTNKQGTFRVSTLSPLPIQRLSASSPPDGGTQRYSHISVYRQLLEPLKHFVMLIVFVGGSRLSTDTLKRITKSRKFINSVGQQDKEDPPVTIKVLRTEESLQWALDSLKSSVIKFEATMHSIYLPIELVQYIQDSTSGSQIEAEMIYTSCIFIAHTFPTDPDTESVMEFAEAAKSQLPHLRHILAYFSTPTLVQRLSEQQLRQLIEACLTSSWFGEQEWKVRVLAIAFTLAKSIMDPLLFAKIYLRQKAVIRLYANIAQDVVPLREEMTHLLAEVTILDVQLLIDKDDLPGAWNLLPTVFTHLQGTPTFVQSRSIETLKLLKMRICHFAGDFETAASYIKSEKFTSLTVFPGYLSHAIGVLCELGRIADARVMLQTDISHRSLDSKGYKARRLSLHSASIDLMDALKQLMERRAAEEVEILLFRARETYADLIRNLAHKSTFGLSATILHFSACCGIAIISQVLFQCGSTTTVLGSEVLKNWESAWNVMEQLESKFGGEATFLRMIIQYSQSNVLHRMQEPHGLAKRSAASIKYCISGRSFYWLALGSLWFDLNEAWSVQHGFARFSMHTFLDYIAVQKARRFPFLVSSTRFLEA